MRSEDQPGIPAKLCGQRLYRIGNRLGEHLDKQRMVEVLAKFDQFGRTVTGGQATAGDVLVVLRATGVTAPCRRGEYRRSLNTVVAHGYDRFLDVRVPVAVAEVHRQTTPTLG